MVVLKRCVSGQPGMNNAMYVHVGVMAVAAGCVAGCVILAVLLGVLLAVLLQLVHVLGVAGCCWFTMPRCLPRLSLGWPSP